MNPAETEKLVLLQQSGEISPADQRRLDAALAASPDARRFRDSLLSFADAARSLPQQPAPDSAARIAARLSPTLRSASPFSLPRKPFLAAAAAAALLLGALSLRSALRPHSPSPVAASFAESAIPDEEWSDPYDADFAELETLLSSISPDPFDSMEL